MKIKKEERVFFWPRLCKVLQLMELPKGTFIKDVRFFFAIFGDTYLCPIDYVLSTYVLCPIFLDIPTYPKIGHPLWTFPKVSLNWDGTVHVISSVGLISI